MILPSFLIKNFRLQSSTESDTSSDEEEDENYGEKRDRFVAHFYKFQDESGKHFFKNV